MRRHRRGIHSNRLSTDRERPRTMSPLRIVVAGVAGSGKTVVGREVAARAGALFVDGDSLHPAANIEKMRFQP